MKHGMAEGFDERSLDDISLEELDKYVSERKLSENISTNRNKEEDSDEIKGSGTSRSRDIQFSIIKNYGPLSERKYSPIFTKIDWNGYIRYDVRGWDSEMKTPKKGISFTEAEIKVIATVAIPVEYGVTITDTYDGGKAKATIFENICYLSEATVKNECWTKEINIANWGYGLKVDMRKWTDDHKKCGKGICITVDEFEKLRQYACDI